VTDSRVIEICGVGPVRFERSRRAKRISITLKPFAGVRVAVPAGASFRKAEEFVQTRMDWLKKHLHKIQQYEKNSRAISATSFNIDRVESRQKLTGRLERLAKKYGFTYNRVFIRNQKTRWGSCSHRNNISLNIKILGLPEELRDYVILHELVHTRVKNHSGEFWAELDRYVANSKDKASRLRQYGLGLF
jgi:predicted metal-dependent hydrolase